MLPTLGQLAEHVDADVRGDATCAITGVATLQKAKAGDISFLSNPRYSKHLAATTASAVILAEEHASACPTNALVTRDPYLAYARIAARCTIGGGVGIVGHTEIADDVHITGMSFVAHSIREPGLYSSGTPLE